MGGKHIGEITVNLKVYPSMRNVPQLKQLVESLGMAENEASIFLALLESATTPMEISRLTGITRSNVYRIVDA